MRLIDADALKKRLQEHKDFFIKAYGGRHNFITNAPKDIKVRVDELNNSIAEVVNAPTVAESCKELHEVATESPQTIDCTNCKYESQRLIDEPCTDCNRKYSEWEAKDETN